MVDHKQLRDALKIMTEAPDSIKRAEDRYKEKLVEIRKKEQSGQWSPNAIKSDRKLAKEDRDRVVGRLMDQMKSAVTTIDRNNSFEGEAFDFSDPKFQSAISFLSLMGKDMTYTDQVNLLENFRGNVGALNALGAAMKKNNLYFADRAKEMTKTIPHGALEDAAYVWGKYEYSGEVDLSHMMWSKSEFKKMAERMGYDMTDCPDPYISALTDARNAIPMSEDAVTQAVNNAKRWKLDAAIQELNIAKATGQGNSEEIFAKAIRSLDSITSGSSADANS